MKNLTIIFLVFLINVLWIDLSAQELGRGKINEIDMSELARKLQGEGLIGWMHGANARYQQYVFTYRDPANFFRYVNLPVVPLSEQSEAILRTLNRHDKVRLKGMFSTSGAPIEHIWVFNVDVEEKYTGAQKPYQHQVKLPDDLLNKDYLEGKIHGVFANGQAVAIEYRDVVIPLLIKPEQSHLTKNLYRNDIIGLPYEIRQDPQRPLHLELAAGKQLKVIDSMVQDHNRQLRVEGFLVKFPQSPQLNRDIYALRVDYPQGISREFTIVNFEDQQLFLDILKKLSDIWEQHKLTAREGRNHLFNPKVRLQIKGIKNVISPTQANPQILVNKLKDIKLL